MKIVGICGSLRQGSYNMSLTKEFGKLLPVDMEFEILDISQFPLFNEDLELNLPEVVKIFKDKIKAADAVLFVTPEYNHSFSGVIKNALDWGTRPSGDNSFSGKPAAIISASTGLFGGVRAQLALRQACFSINLFLLNTPEMILTFAGKKFDENGNLIDDSTREHLEKFAQAFIKWIRRFNN